MIKTVKMWSKKSLVLLCSAVFLVSFAHSTPLPPQPKLIEAIEEVDGVQIAPFADEIDGLEYRLPNNTVPIRYDISLRTEIHAGVFGFTGSVYIRFKTVEPTTTITIHSRQQTISKVNLLNGLGQLLQENVLFDLTSKSNVEFLIITPITPLLPNQELSLYIEYSGTLRGDEAGFYRSSYRRSNGVEVWLATTQFESTDARHGFPCFDGKTKRW